MKRAWIWLLLLTGMIGVAQDECTVDADEDGWTACTKDDDPYGGTCDCDDTRDTVYPGAAEVCYDDIDQDCDGEDWTDCPDQVVEAHPGDMVIDEVMHNTTMVSELDGQWFEITNVTEDKTFDLQGWTFYDGQRTWTFPEGKPYLVAPGDVVPLGLNPDSEKNGHLHIEITYTDLYFDTEHGFRISLERRDHKVIDSVAFSFGPDAFPYIEGHALALSRDHYSAEDNDDPANWCLSFNQLPFATDYGTPWLFNPVCPPDEDKDAYTADVDCDDTNPAVNPGTPENQTNGIDDDCDGEIDELPAYAPGSVIISEIMYNPFQSYDPDGEYIELYNKTNDDIDLKGWRIGVTLESLDSHIIPTSLTLPAHDYLVLGVNDDMSINGGVDVDYVMPRLGLSNAYYASAGYKDRIWLEYDNIEIDAVAYGDGTFPDRRGYAISLDPGAMNFRANDDGHNWCLASSPITDATWVDSGTPGAPNDVCPPDDDGDGYRGDLDCDDADAQVHPGATEVPNGKDDDCNGAVDEPPPGPGSVVIVELMVNPLHQLDYYAEYIELLNPSGTAYVDVNGWTIRDSTTGGFVIDNGGPMMLPPYGFILFSRTGELPLNEGTDPDYVYGSGLGLGQTTPDDVIVEDGDTLIDMVAYDPNDGWDIPEGASLEMSPEVFSRPNPQISNDDPDNWCVGKVEIQPGGDLGTPGRGNSQCPQLPDIGQ